MIRDGGNKVICSLPLRGNRRGEKKVENKRGDEIRVKKKRKRGIGEEGINNPAKS